MRAIIPPRFLTSPARIAAAIESALDEQADALQDDLLKPTRTWRRRPAFTIIRATGRRIVQTDSRIYLFLTRGTRVRYAVMSLDFMAKTTPRVLGAGPGRGGMVFVGKKPLPGIEAREFEEVASENTNRDFPRVIIRHLGSAL